MAETRDTMNVKPFLHFILLILFMALFGIIKKKNLQKSSEILFKILS